MASSTIADFLVSIGFAADEGEARRTEDRIKRVEDTARKSDQARTKTANEQAMERARIALKAEGIERPSLDRIAAKRAEMARTEADHNKRREEADARRTAAQARAVAGMRSLVNIAAATAVAVQGVTVALAGYASHVAGKLEEMAYASDRTKSSVLDLKVFAQAVSQLGGSAGQALNDLEGFAARLRANPQGYTAFLKSVGVEARDAQGNIRGAAELYKEFRKNVGEKSYEQQLLYANEMGISEQTWRATDPAKLAAEEARSRAKYARLGYDPDKAKDDAKALEHAFRDMWESISIVGEKTASKIFTDLGDNLRGFTTFIEQHGDQIAEILSKVAQVVLAVSRALLELLTSDKVKGGLDWLLGMFGHVEEGSGKWVADTEKIKAALEALAIFVATVFVAKITGAFADILKELKPLLLLLAPVFAALGIPILGTAAVGAVLGGLGDPSKSVNGTGGRPDGQMNPGDELPGVGNATPATPGGEGAWDRAKRLGKAALNAVGLGSDPGTPRGSGQGNAKAARTGEMMRYAMDQLRREGVPEDRLRDAAAHLVGQAHMESGLDPNKVHDGGTGYGIYGARDPGGPGKQRRTEMLRWLQQHGYARNSAEGQMRYMAREAMTDRTYDRTRQILMGKGSGDIDQDTNAITRNFERPAVINYRAGAVRDAQRVGPTPAPAPPAPTASEAARAVADKAAAVVDRLDKDKMREIGSATRGFNPSEYLKTAPPIGTTSSSTDNSIRNQTYNGGPTNVTINTHGDVRETADIWRRHGERQKADDVRYASSVFA